MKIEILERTKYYFNDKNQLHREDGPACESIYNYYKAWYLNGIRIGSTYIILIKKNLNVI